MKMNTCQIAVVCITVLTSNPAGMAEEQSSGSSDRPSANGSAPARADEERHAHAKKAFGDIGTPGPRGWFAQLDHAERARLRHALQKVLGDPAVAAARDELMAASEHLKATLRSAIGKEDPKLAEILQRMLKRGGPGNLEKPHQRHQHGWLGRMARADQRRAPMTALEGFHQEIFPRLLEARRQELKEALHAARNSQAVQEAAEKITAATGEEDRRSLAREFRDIYIRELIEQLPGLREVLEDTVRPRKEGDTMTAVPQSETPSPEPSPALEENSAPDSAN